MPMGHVLATSDAMCAALDVSQVNDLQILGRGK